MGDLARTLFGVLSAMCLIDSCAEAQGDLQYDPREDARDRKFSSLLDRTRICLNEGARAQIRLGNRGSASIVEWTSRTCGVPIVVYMVKELHRPIAEASAFVQSLAYRELSEIPRIAKP